MPPSTLFDLSALDLDQIAADVAEIEAMNPQRGQMRLMDRVVWFDEESDSLSYRDVKGDEFWVEGHIPGRPLLPGVLMLEQAAQACSFYTRRVVGWDGFIGFGGVENCKFRLPVEPGARLYVLTRLVEKRHRRVRARCQGLVDGQIVFEADIIGTKM